MCEFHQHHFFVAKHRNPSYSRMSIKGNALFSVTDIWFSGLYLQFLCISSFVFCSVRVLPVSTLLLHCFSIVLRFISAIPLLGYLLFYSKLTNLVCLCVLPFCLSLAGFPPMSCFPASFLCIYSFVSPALVISLSLFPASIHPTVVFPLTLLISFHFYAVL